MAPRLFCVLARSLGLGLMSVAVVLVQRVVQSGGGFELSETSNRKFKFKMDLEEGSPIGEFEDLSEVAQRCSSQFGTSTTGNSFLLFIGNVRTTWI